MRILLLLVAITVSLSGCGQKATDSRTSHPGQDTAMGHIHGLGVDRPTNGSMPGRQ